MMTEIGQLVDTDYLMIETKVNRGRSEEEYL